MCMEASAGPLVRWTHVHVSVGDTERRGGHRGAHLQLPMASDAAAGREEPQNGSVQGSGGKWRQELGRQPVGSVCGWLQRTISHARRLARPCNK